MLPPNIHSRQSSYSAPLLRRSASYAPSHLTDEEELDAEEAAELEDRGLEETLEKLGFGALRGCNGNQAYIQVHINGDFWYGHFSSCIS